jgi:hypothetical protein
MDRDRLDRLVRMARAEVSDGNASLDLPFPERNIPKIRLPELPGTQGHGTAEQRRSGAAIVSLRG